MEHMPSFGTLTPYYSEEVILSLETLVSQTPEGVTTLEYLQTLYPLQWNALVERMRRTMPEVCLHCGGRAAVVIDVAPAISHIL